MIARALLPAFLLLLASFLLPFGNDTQFASCRSWKAMRWMDELDQLEQGPDGRVFMLVTWVSGHGKTLHQHFLLLAGLMLAFSLAYLLIARERILIRVSVFAGVLLTAFGSVFLFGSIC